MNKKLSSKDSKYFSLLKPDIKKQKPFIISSPHAGNIFLSGADTYNIPNPNEYLYMQDMYVNDLILDLDSHGITILQNYVSRLVIDLNRSEQEIDTNFILNIPHNYQVSITPKVKAGLGLIPFKNSSGKNIYSKKLSWTEVCFRLEKFYNPWHMALNKQIKELLKIFGFVFVIDFHSMPSEDTFGNKVSDFVIGNNFDDSSSKFSRECLGKIIQSKGYSCSYNKPYAGGYITKNYANVEKNIECIQIEINKSLYMDQDIYKKNGNYEKLYKDIKEIMIEFINIIYVKNNHKIAAE